MFCKNCGRQLEEGESYCPICGTVNSPEAPIAPGTPFYGEPDERVKSDMAGKTLTWGILSVAFGVSGCLSLLGFIFSFIAKSKALAYEQTFGVLEGKARVGRILGKVGFGVGLGMTIYMGFAVFVGVLAGLAEAGVM